MIVDDILNRVLNMTDAEWDEAMDDARELFLEVQANMTALRSRYEKAKREADAKAGAQAKQHTQMHMDWQLEQNGGKA